MGGRGEDQRNTTLVDRLIGWPVGQGGIREAQRLGGPEKIQGSRGDRRPERMLRLS